MESLHPFWGIAHLRNGPKMENLLEATVERSSQETLVNAYNQAMEKFIPSNINVTWKKKSGGTVVTSVVLVPIAYDDHIFALHFVS